MAMSRCDTEETQVEAGDGGAAAAFQPNIGTLLENSLGMFRL